MRFEKITLDSRPVFRKRTIHFQYQISGRNDNFDCGGEAELMGRITDVMQDINDILSNKPPSRRRANAVYGVSKKETLVSDHFTINGMRTCVGV